jgi:hypothetical protein
MFHAFHAPRPITKSACVAAILVASLVGASTAVVQAGQPTLTFKNSSKLKVSVKVDKWGYREDIAPGSSVAVPANKLQNTDPKDQGIVWEAYQADLKSVKQTSPNPKCDGGKIKFDDKGAATIDIKGSC